MIRIAAYQYQIEIIANWDAYQHKIETIVKQAKQQNVELLLLPEYAGVEIAFGQYATDQELYENIQPQLKHYLNFFQDLAARYHIYLQPGTLIVETSKDKYVNRAYFFGPDGTIGFQDKLQLIEFEKSLHVMQPGQTQTLFDTALGKIGIAICYDSEFPEIIRKLVYAGANLILVPSYTSSLAGFNRVFLSCRARAIENQCYIATAFCVGTVASGGEPDETFGQACILGPADNGFPDDGIFAQGKMNEISLVSADICFEKLAMVRKHGQVHNFEDTKKCDSILKQNLTLLTV